MKKNDSLKPRNDPKPKEPTYNPLNINVFEKLYNIKANLNTVKPEQVKLKDHQKIYMRIDNDYHSTDKKIDISEPANNGSTTKECNVYSCNNKKLKRSKSYQKIAPFHRHKYSN